MFIFIIILTLAIWYNSNNAINIYKDVIEVFQNEKNLEAPYLALDTLNNKKVIVYPTINPENIVVLFSKESYKGFIDELKEIKPFILDGNTISYLFQIITVFLLGLGIFLFDKIEKKVTEINSFSKNMDLINSTNTLIRFCESINYTTMLLKNYESSDKYSKNVIFLSHQLIKKIIEINDFIDSEKLISFSNKYSKDIIVNLLNDSKLIVDQNFVDEGSTYYIELANKIDNLIFKMEKFEALC